VLFTSIGTGTGRGFAAIFVTMTAVTLLGAAVCGRTALRPAQPTR
jgi:hypothetical protein